MKIIKTYVWKQLTETGSLVEPEPIIESITYERKICLDESQETREDALQYLKEQAEETGRWIAWEDLVLVELVSVGERN